jgi:hypothetical protein
MDKTRKLVAMLRSRERHALREMKHVLARKRMYDSEVLSVSVTYYEARACAEAAREMLD